MAQISARAAGWEIRHVSGKENPADWLTKPVKANKFLSDPLWWEGPKWLKNPLNWDGDNEYSLNGEGIVPENNEGDTTVMVGNITTPVNQGEWLPIWKAKTYKKQLMLFVGFVRLHTFLRSGRTAKFPKHVTKNELNKAEVK